MCRAGTSLTWIVAILGASQCAGDTLVTPAPDLTQQPTLYVVGYSHLDTQWLWCYPQVIREMIPKTMHEGFAAIEKYPHFILNFSGANRYRMMKEYFPADYERVKQYIAAGRWFPCGSSMEECDVNATGAESIIRQVLYGNQYFRREFGQASAEFMLPDCFGFPASLPSLLGHCGLKGFSTQKLTWGSAVGIPFNVGVWEGLDGTKLPAALNALSYNGDIETDLSADPKWIKRIDENGKRSGLYVDYHYYGVGDVGGAPRQVALEGLEKSVAGTGPVRVVSATADRMFLDLPADRLDKLPHYQGDLLLTEHSAGSITSQAYMKRWNHKNELLADAAERAAVLAEWLGGPAYPRQRLLDAWTLVMGGQFHDILPGTSLPKAYEYSWNDELLALNQFASVLDSSVGAIAAGLDTQAKGAALVVYNPLSIDREDVVEARVMLDGAPPKAVQVLGPDGKTVPAQILSAEPGALRILFLARVPAVGFAVYDVQPTEAEPAADAALRVADTGLENARYRVTLDANGDVAGIFDKRANRELLSGPARLAFLYDKPGAWPAWNMDWVDLRRPPVAHVDGPAQIRVVERGPVRVALEIVRDSQNSHFVQTIRLAAGDAGERIEFARTIDWQSREMCLKAVFPLAVANPQATYNWEVGTLQRGNNDPRKYEVPTHGWFDLTGATSDYGVTVLSDCKFGSDKPDDQTLRLTLLRTPGTRGDFLDQATQDWGRHEILYGLAGHQGDWRTAQTDWQALRLSQPPLVFQTAAHPGPLGRQFALLKVNHPRVRVLAVKKAEEGDEVIVRLVELNGQTAKDVRVSLPAPIVAAREVDGQERPVGTAIVVNGELVTDFTGYRLRSFALKLGPAPTQLPATKAQPLALTFDRCVTSRDGTATLGGFDGEGRCYPAEMVPTEIAYRGLPFRFGPADGQPNAVTAGGQNLALPAGAFNRVYVLAAASGEREAEFAVDGQPARRTIQDWGGYIGQWDNRIWEGVPADPSYDWPYKLLGVQPAYVRPAPVAWFCSHRHAADGQNEPYAYSYVFAYAFDLPAGAKRLTLPNDPKIAVFAATAAFDGGAGTYPAQPLLDELKRDALPLPRIAPHGGKFTDNTLITLERPLFGGAGVLRYTLDGSEPTPNSPEYMAPVRLNTDTVVKARFFENQGPGGTVAEAHFQVQDTTAPQIQDVVAFTWSPEVSLLFSEELERSSAENTENYEVSGGLKLQSVTLAPDGRRVNLLLSAAPTDTDCGLTVSGVRDLAPAGNAVAKVSRKIAGLRPVVHAAQEVLDGAGDGVELPLGEGAPTRATDPWTINAWLWVDEQPGDFTIIAGFGSGHGPLGTERYLTKFPHGFHFWGSNVDVPAGVKLETGRWQMLTATFDGGVLKLFQDGRELVSTEITLADAEPVAKLGPPPAWSYGHRVAGKVAGFTLWSRALPPASVAALHRLGPEATIP